jgi:hypothetical protein
MDRLTLSWSAAEAFDVAFYGIRDASFAGFSRSSTCSVEDGARARIRNFDDDYEHHFIEHQQGSGTMSSKSAALEAEAGGTGDRLSLRRLMSRKRCVGYRGACFGGERVSGRLAYWTRLGGLAYARAHAPTGRRQRKLSTT